MMKENKKDFFRRNWVECIILSTLIHLILLYLFIGDFLLVKYLPEKLKAPMDVYVVDADQIRRQIVSIDDEKGDEEANPNARFLSKVNKRVDIETRANSWGKPKNRMSGVQTILEQDLDEAISSYIKGRKQKKVQGDGDDYGESTTYDYLPGIRPGDKTMLNTAEIVYYSFYRRVQDSVVYMWNRYVSEYVEKHPDVKKNLGKKDYITEVEAVLDRDGSFIKMVVLRSSGVSGIDEAPGKAFSYASPFHNPPEGMIEEDGYVRMKWRFIVSVVETLKYGVEEINPFNYNDGWSDLALQRETWK